MTRHLPAAITLAATMLLTAACNSGGGSPVAASTTACEQAMEQQLRTAIANPNAPSGTRPAACAGIDNATLNRLAEQAMGNVYSTDLPTPSGFPTSG